MQSTVIRSLQICEFTTFHVAVKKNYYASSTLKNNMIFPKLGFKQRKPA